MSTSSRALVVCIGTDLHTEGRVLHPALLQCDLYGRRPSLQAGDTMTVQRGLPAVSEVVVNSATSISATLTTNSNARAGPQALLVTSSGQKLDARWRSRWGRTQGWSAYRPFLGSSFFYCHAVSRMSSSHENWQAGLRRVRPSAHPTEF